MSITKRSKCEWIEFSLLQKLHKTEWNWNSERRERNDLRRKWKSLKLQSMPQIYFHDSGWNSSIHFGRYLLEGVINVMTNDILTTQKHPTSAFLLHIESLIEQTPASRRWFVSSNSVTLPNRNDTFSSSISH